MATITLETEIEIPDDLDNTRVEMYNEFSDLFCELFETFIEKNLDYGSSFITNGAKRYMTCPDKYEDPAHACMDGLLTRIGDKQERALSLVINGENDRVGESVSDTSRDAAVYWVMMSWMAESREKITSDGLSYESTHSHTIDDGHTAIPNGSPIECTGSVDFGITSPEDSIELLEEIGTTEATIRETVDNCFGKGTYNEVASQ